MSGTDSKNVKDVLCANYYKYLFPFIEARTYHLVPLLNTWAHYEVHIPLEDEEGLHLFDFIKFQEQISSVYETEVGNPHKHSFTFT